MRRPLALFASLPTLALLLSCAGDPQTAPELAKSGPAPAGDPTVTGAEPATAPRDTTLDVRIAGSGFDRGSRVDFAVAGIIEPKLQINSTTYRNSAELIANVSVASDAPLVTYDVLVTTTRGKKGIGSEMFLVTEANPSTTWIMPLDESLAIRGDGELLIDGESYYRNGECGLESAIFIWGSSTGDNVVKANTLGKKRGCAVVPRRLIVEYPDGVIENAPFDANLIGLHALTQFIPVGETEQRTLNIALASSRCDILRYGTTLQTGAAIDADRVDVTRVDYRTWLVESRPPPSNRAYCRSTGVSYAMPVRFKVVASRVLNF
jgi:hypothetical protein